MKFITRKGIIAAIINLSIAVVLILFLTGEDKSMYLYQSLTKGHQQLKDKCTTCHSGAFSNKEDLHKACLNCHEKELERADDSHPVSKHTNPRNADRVKNLDARNCITCHSEHKHSKKYTAGVSMPTDFCFYCHSDIAEERKSHRGLAFNTCQSAGCHNYHDNRALYEDYLIKVGKSDSTPITQKVEMLNLLARYRKTAKHDIKQLTKADNDAQQKEILLLLSSKKKANAKREISKAINSWQSSKHAKSGINCSHCHQANTRNAWQPSPTNKACRNCHESEQTSFLEGKHGIRLKLKLSPMQPIHANIPMKQKAAHKDLNCNSCHKAHEYNTRKAAVDSCLNCHNDEHSKAYKKSPHFKLWQSEMNMNASQNISLKGTGVSCATCHLPRINETNEGKKYTWVQHNQNDTLSPNEKMIRPVCLKCHSLRFSLNALADKELIKNNFNGKSKINLKTINWAIARHKEKTLEKIQKRKIQKRKTQKRTKQNEAKLIKTKLEKNKLEGNKLNEINQRKGK